MTKPMVRIYKNVNEYTDREMDDVEFAQYEIDVANSIAQKAAETEAKAAKETAKAAAQAKLTALGLTIEDLQALGL